MISNLLIWRDYYFPWLHNDNNNNFFSSATFSAIIPALDYMHINVYCFAFIRQLSKRKETVDTLHSLLALFAYDDTVYYSEMWPTISDAFNDVPLNNILPQEFYQVDWNEQTFDLFNLLQWDYSSKASCLGTVLGEKSYLIKRKQNVYKQVGTTIIV